MIKVNPSFIITSSGFSDCTELSLLIPDVPVGEFREYNKPIKYTAKRGHKRLLCRMRKRGRYPYTKALKHFFVGSKTGVLHKTIVVHRHVPSR